VWRELAAMGITELGSDPAQGRLRELLVVLEELGRGGCPAPLLGAGLVNLADAASGADGEWGLLPGAVARGEAVVSVAFGGFDGDVNAGNAVFADGVLNGRIAFVEDVASASHVLVLAEPGPVLALVRRDAAGLTMVETPGFAVPALAELSFENTPAAILPIPAARATDLNLLARLGLTARALGAACRGFELVVEYAKERQQFGQPIGRFQAIQHKLATCVMSLEAVRPMLMQAAAAFDHDDPVWRLYASAAYAFAGPALRQVSLETHHTFGAIGYSEEHEAPRHFRRVHADLVRFGGVRRAREELARYLLDEGHDLPDHDLGPAGNRFRAEVRRWLADYWSGARKARYDRQPMHERWIDREFTAALGEKGWTTLSWPTAFGGEARGPMEQLAFKEELYRVQAPMVGESEIQAHAIMMFGTPAQQAEYLPKLRSGQISFCLGYSEPQAGSDLAALATRAVREGDEWVINGRKVWTTGAEFADCMWLAARTDPQAQSKHAGISMFIVPMNAPGLTIRPSMALYGHTFCEETLENVRIPAANLVGPLNGGWKILTSALATERIVMGSFVARLRAEFESLLGYLRTAQPRGAPLAADPTIRDRIGSLAADIEAARQLMIQSVIMMEQGKVPVHEAAISKAFTAELMSRMGETVLDIAGMGGSLHEGARGAITDGRLEQSLRQSMMMVVGGGSAEIQRNLIAQRGLNLPR
jgi:alkylation response protein AidB-like acyl-CoA dehydrogenase